ncbi:hypothetical protein [uncultured Allofournierella sp.]|uniref:hypothetical protein n=1 Tax=uncultured Allofournierella sp. TaxID=1940258 RepID=UPI0025E8B8D8|nr:hypothetical protein [uncultured Fournierella sp.]
MAQPITAITKIISTCLRESPPSGSTARMVGGQALPVSRSCREQALLALTRAVLEE